MPWWFVLLTCQPVRSFPLKIAVNPSGTFVAGGWISLPMKPGICAASETSAASPARAIFMCARLTRGAGPVNHTVPVLEDRRSPNAIWQRASRRHARAPTTSRRSAAAQGRPARVRPDAAPGSGLEAATHGPPGFRRSWLLRHRAVAMIAPQRSRQTDGLAEDRSVPRPARRETIADLGRTDGCEGSRAQIEHRRAIKPRERRRDVEQHALVRIDGCR